MVCTWDSSSGVVRDTSDMGQDGSAAGWTPISECGRDPVKVGEA